MTCVISCTFHIYNDKNVIVGVGGSSPETLAVYSGFFFYDVVLLLDVGS